MDSISNANFENYHLPNILKEMPIDPLTKIFHFCGHSILQVASTDITNWNIVQAKPSLQAYKIFMELKKQYENVKNLKSSFEKGMKLALIAQGLAFFNKETAMKVADLALKEAEILNNVELFKDIAVCIADFNQKKSFELIDRAMDIIITKKLGKDREIEFLIDTAQSLLAIDPQKALEKAELVILKKPNKSTEIEALVICAKVLALLNPNEAIEKLENALQIANSFDEEEEGEEELERKYEALEKIAAAWAMLDPDKALEVVNSIDWDFERLGALVTIGKALALSNPKKAMEILGFALRCSLSIKCSFFQTPYLSSIAQAYALFNLDKAFEMVAHLKEVDDLHYYTALMAIAKALSVLDPQKSKKLAMEVFENTYESSEIEGVALCLVKLDPEEAIKVIDKDLVAFAKSWEKIEVLVKIIKRFFQ